MERTEGDAEHSPIGRINLAAIVESSDDAIITKTLHGVITSWNPGAERTFGYTAAEALGQSITMLMTPEYYSQEVEIISKITRGERIEHYETVRRKKCGTLIDISLTISPLKDEHGKVIGASKIARDITARKKLETALRESEERLRAIVTATPECVKIVDPDGKLLFMNSAGLHILEAPCEEQIQGTCVYDLIAPHHRTLWIENHRRVCAGETLNWEFEIVSLGGQHHWMETHAVPLLLSDGKQGQLAVTREVTARKHADEEREQLLERERRAREAAERMSILKDEFLATLSHELRTPLNGILGWAQLLSKRFGEQRQLAEGLTVIQRNARLQSQLIEDLLDMSRITSGKMRLEIQPCNISDIVMAALDALRPVAELKQVRLQSVLDPHAGVAQGDPVRLQQCFWNLLSNAIKFTPRDGKVQVILKRVNSHLEISVTDTGQGITPEFLPYVFERFRQGDSSITREHGGLGLGLAIVKHLVELHGGRVRANSSGVGRGASFSIELPLVAVHPQSPGERLSDWAPASTGPVAQATSSLNGISVLVLDDEPDARELVRIVLEEAGAEVRAFESARAALEALDSHVPDVIVSDIGMPGGDGYAFMSSVRQRPAAQGGAVPAAALTAFARPEDRTRALRAGYQTHIAKPVEPAELTAAVAALATICHSSSG